MFAIIAVITMLLSLRVESQEAVITWKGDLHQIVIAKATSLMPSSLQRQILRHRRAILAGCLDVLREGLASDLEGKQVIAAQEKLVSSLKSKVSFERICYQLGRLSTLITEHSSPLRGASLKLEADRFRDFISTEAATFPLVISRAGEGFLREGSLSDYLEFRQSRNQKRQEQIEKALNDSPDDWKSQRSAAFGIASLCYNDMVLDTARIWLFTWQEAGGSVSKAPYFELPEK